MTRRKRIGLGLLSLALAAAVWLPSVHFLCARDATPVFRADAVPPRARELAARQIRLWTDPALREREIGTMRRRNAEWDFMGRSYLVWALANLALRDPGSKAACLDVMDRVLDETLRLERERGHLFFLLGYARARPFVVQPARSLFVDGEVALMLGARRLVEEREDYKPLLADRVRILVDRMRQSPVLSAESYPDECWTFCNAIALAAVKVSDVLEGADHSAFLRSWVETAKRKLVHPETGLLVSSYTVSGRPMDGPEGSSIWMVAHCLQLVDPAFAADQYARARKELGRVLCGFGYAREWPVSWEGPADVDSGPVVPALGAGAGASGLAFVGAAAFGDGDYFSSLAASLEFAGFPRREEGGLRYCASNQVGDAVVLYAHVLGPLWERVKERGREAR